MFFKICLSIAVVLIASGDAAKLKPRIAGGSGLHVNRVPWQVSVQYEGGHRCGGSIIDKNWILTSALCITHIQNLKDTLVRSGTVFHDFGDDISVKRVIQHHQFDESSADYDFALLELSDALKYGNATQPIKLPGSGEKFEDNRNCLVSGWGDTLEGENSPVHLRAVEVPLVNQEKCVKAYKNYERHPTERMICAGSKGKGPCIGDAGGPLVAFDSEPWWQGSWENAKLVGIVSWANGCADARYPYVYSRVAAVRDWIKSVASV